MRPYKNVSIFPKVIQEKPLSEFSAKEKKFLTRKKFRWYVYYDYLNPETGEFERQQPIYLKLNRDFPDFDDRFREIRILHKSVKQFLKEGHNPYSDKIDTVTANSEPNRVSITSAMDFAVEIKNKTVGERTWKGYEGSANAFSKWLKRNGHSNKSIAQCNKKLVVQFLDSVSSTVSNRTRNNHKSNLSAVFEVLLEHEYITTNYITSIKNLKTAEKRDPTYTDEEVDLIMDYLDKHDPVLKMFVYFVSFMFWRPKENCRLQVKDVNLNQKIISEATKTKAIKTKLIPNILFDELASYIGNARPNDLLFTPTGPGNWDAKLDNRRNSFSTRFREVVKKNPELKVNPLGTIYSFRHTFVTRTYKNLRKDFTRERALDELAHITGHTSDAIKNYIHYLDAETVEDYSKYLKK